MTKEQIRKLLGGYATNTLSESERKALFDAALDDQELFDALEQEEALKEVLADPVARAQVEQALAQLASGKQQAGWRLRWWAWGGAVGAVAAAAIVFAVIRSSRVPNTAPATEIASAERSARTVIPEQTPGRARERKQPGAEQSPLPALQSESQAQFDARRAGAPGEPGAKAKDEEARNAPEAAAAPSAIPAPARPSAVQQLRQSSQPVPAGQGGQSAAVAGAASQLSAQGQAQAPPPVKSFRDALSAQAPPPAASRLKTASNSIAPDLRYSLVKHDASGAELPVSEADLKAGDEVRLNVSTGVPGYLVLYQIDSTGGSKPITSLVVTGNSTQTIPPDAIRVQSAPQRFRLALEPAGASLQVSGGAKAAKPTTAAAPATRESDSARTAKAAAAQPLVMDFTLAGK
ncbi:MAG TPA: hypothetical protein VEV17_10435 [Bryobacteraceae bacterium]|nr:hypothetical protein [Bryobacteraceae bacterium]